MKNRTIGLFTANILLLFLFAAVSLFLFGCKGRQEQVKKNEFYVCSMDPQVMEKHSGMCPICKMPLTKTTIDPGQMNGIRISDEQSHLANIQVEVASKGTIGRGTTLNGVFAINQNKTEQVSAKIRGRIERLYFKVVGTQVNAGNKLYDLYSRELLQAQEEYLLAIEKGKILQVGGQNLVQAARNKLLLWGLTEGQVLNLEKTGQPQITSTIFSKCSGVVTEAPLKEGDYVNEGSEIFKLADLSTLWVETQVYTNELTYLREGQDVEINPEPYPNDHLRGVVTFANPELQQQSKVNLMRAEVINSGGKYKPGMQAYVNIRPEQKSALVLPNDAVIQGGGNAVVWVEKETNTFEPHIVQTGIQTSDKIEITSGLKEGDKVVISGAYLLNSEYIFKKGMNPSDRNDTNKRRGVQNISGMKM